MSDSSEVTLNDATRTCDSRESDRKDSDVVCDWTVWTFDSMADMRGVREVTLDVTVRTWDSTELIRDARDVTCSDIFSNLVVTVHNETYWIFLTSTLTLTQKKFITLT